MSGGHAKVVPILDMSVREICTHPYKNHPRGCPNFGKRRSCPPRVALFTDFVHEEDPVYVVWNRFDIGSHYRSMKEKHPDWTDSQLYCCLYWQPRARKQLKVAVEELLVTLGSAYFPLYCPEAMGVNVTETMKQVGVVLEWPPVNWAYQVALVVIPKRT